MYATMIPMLAQAKKDGKGVPAFNIHALEVVPMMAHTAAEKNCPVILQVSVSTAKYIGFKLLSTVVKEIAEGVEIPVALHLDHAAKLEDIAGALEGGFQELAHFLARGGAVRHAQQVFPGGGQPGGVHVPQTALADAVEGAHAVDLVAEKLDAQGVRLGGWINVHNGSAQGTLAGALHHVHPLVARLHQMGEQVGGGNFISHVEGEGHCLRKG